ncbi:hypothetical protein [Streptomyces sp. 2A115]|uniref:hypothetical protein n=1 Tax=Streptomyces sp. 2A115 TaxID=3457439 RepID=UPI003FD3F234
MVPNDVAVANPVFEHPGHYVAHLPGVGSYEGVCDSSGSPLVELTAVLDALITAPDSASAFPPDHLARLASFFAALRRVQTVRRP